MKTNKNYDLFSDLFACFIFLLCIVMIPVGCQICRHREAESKRTEILARLRAEEVEKKRETQQLEVCRKELKNSDLKDSGFINKHSRELCKAILEKKKGEENP